MTRLAPATWSVYGTCLVDCRASSFSSVSTFYVDKLQPMAPCRRPPPQRAQSKFFFLAERALADKIIPEFIRNRLMKPPTTAPKIFAGFAAHDDDKQKGQAKDGGQVEV